MKTKNLWDKNFVSLKKIFPIYKVWVCVLIKYYERADICTSSPVQEKTKMSRHQNHQLYFFQVLFQHGKKYDREKKLCVFC